MNTRVLAIKTNNDFLEKLNHLEAVRVFERSKGSHWIFKWYEGSSLIILLEKRMKKNAKPIEGQGKKQVDAIQSLNVPNKQLMSIKDLFPTNHQI